jgi:hypothetical protein
VSVEIREDGEYKLEDIYTRFKELVWCCEDINRLRRLFSKAANEHVAFVIGFQIHGSGTLPQSRHFFEKNTIERLDRSFTRSST